jgi:hypothetical protein
MLLFIYFFLFPEGTNGFEMNIAIIYSIASFSHTAKTQYQNSKQILPEKELRGYSPNNYIHVSVSDLYIPYSAAGK